MSYLTYALLLEDADFARRSRACITEQSNGFINDTQADIVALAKALLRGSPVPMQSMLQGISAGPGFDTAVDTKDGTIDQSQVTDEEILAQCQAIYPTVASLYFDSTGTPIP